MEEVQMKRIARILSLKLILMDFWLVEPPLNPLSLIFARLAASKRTEIYDFYI